LADEDEGFMPAALADRPLLFDHLIFVWEAFNALSGDRQSGLGVIGQIPFVAIDRFADRYGIADRDEFACFHGHIKAMDRVWRGVMTERMSNAQPR
jgi:hypothetical protein